MFNHRARNLSALFVLTTVLVLPACDDDPAGPGANALVGTWNVTSFSALDMDIIQEGTSVAITFASNGSYLINIENDVAGLCDGEIGDDCTLPGPYEATSTTVTLDPDDPESIVTFNYTISGSTLTLTGSIDGNPVTITATRAS